MVLAARLPDGPKDLPIRQLIEMGIRPLAFLDRCRRDHGDVFTIRLHVNDMVGLVLGDRSVLLMNGNEHRRERHLLMPIFHANWVSTAGHAKGRLWFRWFLPEKTPDRPSSRVVPLAEAAEA